MFEIETTAKETKTILEANRHQFEMCDQKCKSEYNMILIQEK
jgi:hypothetical protein